MLNIIQLSNGIPIIFEQRSWSRSLALILGIRKGSANSKITGLVNLVCHMLLQGTQSSTPTEIYQRIEKTGGAIDVKVQRDLSQIKLLAPANEITTPTNILFELITEPKLTEESLQILQKKIAAEILSNETNGIKKSIQILYEHTFSSPFGSPIRGKIEELADITLDDVKNQLSTLLQPSNLLLTVLGNYNQKELMGLLKNKFGTYSGYESSEKIESRVSENYPISIEPSSNRVAIVPDEKTQAHITIGVPSAPITSPDYYAYILLNDILGGTMSSRLYTEIREKRGLAYVTLSAAQAYQNNGLLLVYTGVEPAKIEETIMVIQTQLQALAENPVSNQELADSKNHVKGQLRLAYEIPINAAEWITSNWIRRGDILQLSDLQEALDRVTPAKIMTAANIFSTPENWTKILLGSIPLNLRNSFPEP